MKAKIFCILISTSLVLTIGYAGISFAERASTVEEGMTEEQIRTKLGDIFEQNLDIVSAITGLERVETENGVVYMFRGVALGDMQKPPLVKLLQTVNSQLSWKNTQKWERQRKELKDINDLNKTQREMKQLRDLNRK